MIWVILIVGFALRLISINQSLWLDEAINIIAVRHFSFLGTLTQYSIADFHPPGYFIIIWIWGRLFGFTEVSMRMPSVIFGLGTIYLIFLIGKRLASKKVGLIAACLLATNPLHIYYSQEARMYSMAAFAVLLNAYLFIKLMKNEKINMFYLIFGNVLVFASDYVAYLIFPAQFILLLFLKQLGILKKWLVNLMIASFVGIWWLPIFLKQINIGTMTSVNIPAWREIVGAFGLKPLALTYIKFIIGRVSFSDPFTYLATFSPIGLLFLFLIYKGIGLSDKFVRKVLVFFLLVPIILASIISVFIPVYSYFRLLFVLPFFLLLVSLGIYSLKSKLKFIALSLVILIEVVFSLVYLLDPVFQREDWRGVVNFLRTVPQASKILFESSGTFSPFDYYAGNNISGIGALKKFPADNDSDVIDLNYILENSRDVYLVNYLVDISDPKRLVHKQLLWINFKQTDTKNFNGVGFVYHYIRK